MSDWSKNENSIRFSIVMHANFWLIRLKKVHVCFIKFYMEKYFGHHLKLRNLILKTSAKKKKKILTFDTFSYVYAIRRAEWGYPTFSPISTKDKKKKNFTFLLFPPFNCQYTKFNSLIFMAYLFINHLHLLVSFLYLLFALSSQANERSLDVVGEKEAKRKSSSFLLLRGKRGLFFLFFFSYHSRIDCSTRNCVD